MDSLSLPEARKLALASQGFHNPRPKEKVNASHMKEAMRLMGLVQLDAVPTVIRSQYMPFFSRLGNYETGLYDRIAYQQDQWFELWAHEASIAPIHMEPYFRFNKERAKKGETWKGLYKVGVQHSEYVKTVLNEVVKKGPIKAKELDDPRPKGGNGWGSRSMGQLALNWLYRIGEVGIRREKNFEKKYDLFSRIVPEKILALPTPDEETSIKTLFISATESLGIATAADIADYFRIRHSESKRFLKELVCSGDIQEVAVEGWRDQAYVPKSFQIPTQVNATAILTPFDPIVWNRKRLERLFDFNYKIEIYKPKEKRQYGYYVMPFLLDDKIVARFDLKNERATSSLHVLGAFSEKNTRNGEIAHQAHEELNHLASFLGSSTLKFAKNGNFSRTLIQESRNT